MDQLLTETILSVQPDMEWGDVLTAALHSLMEEYASRNPVADWAAMVSSPHWREQRPEIARQAAEQWFEAEDLSESAALLMGKVQVMAIEAVAGCWTPEQCRVMSVRIDGNHRMSLVCSVGG